MTGEDDLVFPGPLGGYLDDSALRRRYKAARDNAGLRPLRFHDLRHTFGTHAIRTADPRELQEWMGHADFSTTEIYLSYKPRADAARRLAAAFAEQPGGQTRDARPDPGQCARPGAPAPAARRRPAGSGRAAALSRGDSNQQHRSTPNRARSCCAGLGAPASTPMAIGAKRPIDGEGRPRGHRQGPGEMLRP